MIFSTAFLVVSTTKAADSLPWISSALSIQKQADTQSLPSSLNGNIDCAVEDAANCSVATTYGAAGQGSRVRLNGSADFVPVISYIDSRQRFLPVPNSNTFITYTAEPPYGFYLYFNYNFSSSITKTFISGTNQTAYKVNRQPDGKLADKANHRLAADYTSISFSQNGQWMVVSQPNVAMLRVNLQTFEVLPFAPGFNYTIGLSPAPKTAITNDGRYAVVASKDFGRFILYDLNTCGAVPDTINGPASCQSRDLTAFMRQQIPGYSFTSYARFMDNNTLAIYATYKSGDVNKTARFIISNSAITSQINYLALGDSYISGEGAFDYRGGTDVDSNKCHLSFLAYPYLIGHDLSLNSYHSVACSGAITDDITNSEENYRGQSDNKKVLRKDRSGAELDSIFASFKPGYVNQSDFVGRYQPQIITVSIGGNDMGFSKIIMSCVPFWQPNTCYSSYEDRLELVRQINNQVFPKLVQTYQKIRAAGPPDMRLYTVGYPQIALPGGDCAVNVRLNNDELIFTRQLITYLNQVIQQAAAKTGIYYVDVEDALNGHRLCEAKPGSVAMNGLTGGNDRPSWLGGPIGVESYHPNALGYQLLENMVLAATNNLTDPMPAANPAAAPPLEAGLAILDAPRSGRPVKVIQYNPSLTNDTAFRGVPAEVTLSGSAHSLPPFTTLQAELHSDTVPLGSYKTDINGDLTAQIILPADVPTGYHSLHFYGTDITGQSIDIYKIIYVGGSADDLDGNGTADNLQACVGLPSSGQDYDQDGIDDACDSNITEAPVPPVVEPAAELPVPTQDPSPTPSQTDSPQTDTEILQPSIGLAANASIALAIEPILGQQSQPQTSVSQQPNNADKQETRSTEQSPPTVPMNNETFFASYYSLPQETVARNVAPAANHAKVLATQLDTTAKQETTSRRSFIWPLGLLAFVSALAIIAKKQFN